MEPLRRAQHTYADLGDPDLADVLIGIYALALVIQKYMDMEEDSRQRADYARFKARFDDLFNDHYDKTMDAIGELRSRPAPESREKPTKRKR